MIRKNKCLSIDPSGTGTTGVFFINTKTQESEFSKFQNTNWHEHLRYLVEYISQKKPEIIIYEHTNYIHKKTADGLGLFKLFGAIEGLHYTFSFLTQIKFIPVIQVKSFYKRLLKGQESINGLIYKVGRGGGWIYKEQRLSLHELDALLIYHLWNSIQQKES